MNPLKGTFFVGLASALAAVVIAPVLLPALQRSSRPITKGLIKAGVALYEKGREMTAYAGEVVEDVMAEIQAEQAEQSAQASGSELNEITPVDARLKPVSGSENARQERQQGMA